MKLLKLTLQNFLSYQDKQVIDLQNQGLVCISGGNGEGKSSILIGIIFCIYGELEKKIKSDQVVNNIVGKNCIVSLELEDADHNYVITRKRKAGGPRVQELEILVDGQLVQMGINQDTQELVNTIIGMDLETFKQSVFLAYRNSSFCSMTDKEQKAILDDILQINVFSRAHQKVRERLQQRKTNLNGLEINLQGFKLQLEGLLSNYNKINTLQEQYNSVKLSKIKDLEQKKHSIHEELKTLDMTFSSEFIQKSIKEQSDLLNKKRTDEQQNHSKLLKYIDIINTQKVQLQRKIVAVEEQKKAAQATSVRMQDLVNTTCENCLQPVPPDYVDESLTSLDMSCKELDSIYNQLYSAYQEIEGKEKQVREGIQADRERIIEEISAIQLTLQNFNNDLRATKVCEEKVQYLKDNLQQISNGIKVLEKEENPYVTVLEDIVKAMGKVKDSLEITKTNFDLIHKEIKHLEFWENGFGNQGVKNYIMDGILPYLNDRANYYSQILSEGNIRIEFTTQKQLGSGEVRDKFQVLVTNNQGADCYHGNSEGEKRRADIAVGWALGDLAATRAKKPIRFKGLDEVFDCLDQSGIDAVVRLLHHALKEYDTIMIITHNDGIKESFNKELRVSKKNGKSTIERIS